MNTDDLLIQYTDSALQRVDDFEKLINQSFDATVQPLRASQWNNTSVSTSPVMPCESTYASTLAGTSTSSSGTWVSIPIAHSSPSVSTPLDPHVTYSKADCPEEVDTALRERIFSAHGKLIHLAVWAQPDLAHSVSVLGRYVHNPSQKHWDSYVRIAKYLVRTKDYRLVFGTIDPEGIDSPYFYTDSAWGDDLDERRSTGSFICFSTVPVSAGR
jgi:hypothetical protein